MRSTSFRILAVALAGAACSPKPAPAPAPTPARGGQRTTAQQGSDSSPGEQQQQQSGRAGGVGGAGAQLGDPNPRPYNRVVTGGAKTRSGLLKVHRVGNRLLFEIPRREFNKDLLLVSEIAKTTLGVGYGGQALNERVMRWERRDNRVLLRGVSYDVTAGDTTSPVRLAVQAANVSPIIAVFNVEAYGPDSASVIDVTRLFTQVPTELSPAQRISPRAQLDASRSWIERAVSFPDNVNVETTLTYAIPPAQPGAGGAAPSGRFGQSGAREPSATVVMSYSFHKLPELPMMPRLCDNRVGYFSVTTTDFTRPEQRVSDRCYITRYRLEKKDPNAALSEPVKPIVYYIDPATPRQWVPWVVKGIESWQAAFEAAGFKNAIIGREAPANDPDWSPEDARYSIVRWLPSTVENASGPSVTDPRSGEIINAHIQFYQNVQNLARTWYYTQVAALDPRARTFPLPDSLMGRLLQYVVAHEVGHTLGFQHNMKASSYYAIDSIRNKEFVRRMGHTPTLMDYSRFNYVAQPEDSIPVELLVPDIGPYDIWATKWGYAPIPGARTPDEERPTLDAWAREQDAKPYLRFSTSGSFGADPGEESEAVGDIDAVKATALGIKNLKRGMQWLQQATVRPTEDFDELSLLYDRMLSQWRTEMNHVGNVIGGAESQEKYGSQPGARFTALPKARQKEAMRFLAEHAFQTPTYMIDREVRGRLGPIGEINRIERAQSAVLSNVLNDGRMSRLIEFQATAKNPAESYSLGEMLGDLRRAVWEEIYGGAPKVDAYRRALQRAYIEQIARKIRPPANAATTQAIPARLAALIPAANTGEIRVMLRGELRDLDRELAAAVSRAADRDTRLHLEGARAAIKEVLEPAGNGETP